MSGVRCHRRLETISLSPGKYATIRLNENDILDIVSVAFGEEHEGKRRLVVTIKLGEKGEEIHLTKLTPGLKEQEIIHMKIPSSLKEIVIGVEAIGEEGKEGSNSKIKQEKEIVDILIEHTTVLFGSIEEDVKKVMEAEKELEELKRLETELEKKRERNNSLSRVGTIIKQKKELKSAKEALKERVQKQVLEDEQKKKKEEKAEMRKEQGKKKIILLTKINKVGSMEYEVIKKPASSLIAKTGDFVSVIVSESIGGNEPKRQNLSFRIGASVNIRKRITQLARGMGIGEVRRSKYRDSDKDITLDVEMKSIKIDDE